MAVYQKSLSINTRGKGTVDITAEVSRVVRQSSISSGFVSVFCKHTSCSLVIMENADPSARRDLEYFMDRLVPENYPGFVHTYEGPDDMPSHIKMALTRSSETIPLNQGNMLLGTWQGIFLWEHRAQAHSRNLIVTVQGE